MGWLKERRERKKEENQWQVREKLHAEEMDHWQDQIDHRLRRIIELRTQIRERGTG